MIAVHLEGGRLEVRSSKMPRRPRGYATIRLLYGGICNTDLELQRGYNGFTGTPGHEFVGEVIDADSPTVVGKRVVGEINIACYECRWCRRGLARHCPRRSVLGILNHPGAFREVLTLPERNLYLVPQSVDSALAVFVEPVAAACEILEQVKIPKDKPVAVLGDGKLGLLISQVLQTAGARVHQFGRHRRKLRIAEAVGVTGEISNKRPVAEYDVVIDATGAPDGLRQAVSMTRPRGTVVMKSTIHDAVTIDTAPLIVNEITLVGSRCGRFEPALELLSQSKIQIGDMISETIPLASAPKAFERAAKPGILKVLLRN